MAVSNRRRIAFTHVPMHLSCGGFHLRCANARSSAQGVGHMSVKLTPEEYLALLQPLSAELASMARWVAETEQRIIVLFEGRDTAGKGGSIDMIARILNPRQCRVVALPSPNERERTQWYFQRYVSHLPAA